MDFTVPYADSGRPLIN